MPPRIRTRTSKALKENCDLENKIKNIKTNTKVPRKALADKTNSASDDTSVEVPRKVKADVRPRRDRRLPSRFVENSVLTNLSNNSKDITTVTSKTNNVNKPNNIPTANNTPAKNTEHEISPFKTPSKVETSLVVSRPRRICRLPSRFEDHSVSPNKFIPIQPASASTPKQQTKAKPLPTQANNERQKKSQNTKNTLVTKSTRSARAATLQKKLVENTSIEKSSPDSNNNAKAKCTKNKKTQQQQPSYQKTSPKFVSKNSIKKFLNPTGSPQSSPAKRVSPKSAISMKVKNNKTQQQQPSPKKTNPKLISNNSIRKFFNRTASPHSSPTKGLSPQPVINKNVKYNNNSFKILGDKKCPQKKSINDIYEFTFDPSEEPLKQKKKRKRPVTNKPLKSAKPKGTTTYKSTYDQNISKALSALKNIVNPSKPTEPAKLPQIQEISDEVPNIAQQNNIVTNNITTVNKENQAMHDVSTTSVHECNYPSIRVEDIAADIEPSIDHYNDINYSPVNSPRPKSPAAMDPRQSPETSIHNKDPLNLQEDLSFFEDVPVASSSMNMSVRHPLASPWRVEFGSLPIKWHSNAYVKPNMTPAVESSFICSNDSNKKHVYTNMVPESNESLPQIVSDTPSLKQPSIISFIKEVAERQAKKKRGRSVSPTKALFENINTHISDQTETASSNQLPEPIFSNSSEEMPSNNDKANNKENSKEQANTRKRRNNENVCDRPAKSPRKQKDKDCTYFGFDDSENQDQENSPPDKGNVRGRALRSQSRAILKEINGPTRAAVPISKSKTATSSEATNKVFDGLKSAADAPVFPEKNVESNIVVEDPLLNEDSQSVHLFEDIEVVHHLKPTRKSYGKAKKVTFRQGSVSHDETQEGNDTSFENELGDLTFEVPNVKEKKKAKKRPKKLMSKKEEKEAEAWAAGFNSMCEEIEDFPLVVE